MTIAKVIVSMAFVIASAPLMAYEAKIRYAKGFEVRYEGEIRVVKVFNLRDPHEASHSYVLVPKNLTDLPVRPEGQIIRTPVDRAGSMSTTHLSHFLELGLRRRLKAFANLAHILSADLKELVHGGLIEEMGSNINEMVETAMRTKIEMIFGFGPGNPISRFEGLVDAGIPVVLNREYMEAHPLAYAEWIKFTALFFHQESLAERIFNTLEKRYLDLSRRASECTFKPQVLMNALYQGTWYLPGGKTYWANLIKDANANYILKNNQSMEGGIPHTFEEVHKLAGNALYWINADGFTCAELAHKDPRYERFGAFHKKNIFNRNKKASLGLEDDYYENGLSHPDVLLKDLISIFHPEIISREDLVWFRKAP